MQIPKQEFRYLCLKPKEQPLLNPREHISEWKRIMHFVNSDILQINVFPPTAVILNVITIYWTQKKEIKYSPLVKWEEITNEWCLADLDSWTGTAEGDPVSGAELIHKKHWPKCSNLGNDTKFHIELIEAANSSWEKHSPPFTFLKYVPKIKTR